ncbi:MAG: hypothetical protein LBK95_13630, partial [Bifidobacteriaceae bacterium]|nr:hypothetical protein [Bifidobacteriaceae bacterium]
MKKRRIIALGAASALAFGLGAGPALAAPEDASIDSVTVITEVDSWGYMVAGVALDYGEVIPAGTVIDPAAFEVEQTLQAPGAQNPASQAARTVTAAYT